MAKAKGDQTMSELEPKVPDPTTQVPPTNSVLQDIESQSIKSVYVIINSNLLGRRKNLLGEEEFLGEEPCSTMLEDKELGHPDDNIPHHHPDSKPHNTLLHIESRSIKSLSL